MLDGVSFTEMRSEFSSYRKEEIRLPVCILDCVELPQMLAGSQREKLAALIESSAARAAETLKQEAEEHDVDVESSFESIADASDWSRSTSIASPLTRTRSSLNSTRGSACA